MNENINLKKITLMRILSMKIHVLTYYNCSLSMFAMNDDKLSIIFIFR